ncbi:hypothetical protein NPIL_457141 [Nephila pilipes]|uniref:Uncharacterized protein n=1 Tax=Nephila pilipes TaxID=299642 RepID=A0A8X6PCQ6_NEPPI|nr:hypothetical protein NPIL_457141 [Nephila pilipes]
MPLLAFDLLIGHFLIENWTLNISFTNEGKSRIDNSLNQYTSISFKMRTSHFILICFVFCSLVLTSSEVVASPHKVRRSIHKRDDYSIQNLGKEMIHSIIDGIVDTMASVVGKR